MLPMRILAINCGSSSLKFTLVELSGRTAAFVEWLASGRIDDIGGQATAHFKTHDGRETHDTAEVRDHASAMHLVLDQLGRSGASEALHLDGIGHRVVHGGPRLFEPVLINDEILAQIKAAAELAPLHNDTALSAIHAAHHASGGNVPMVAVFDTAFYQHLPERSARYAIPPEAADQYGVRRYGFHGLAHRWMAERCARLMGQPLAQLKLITLQLGGGCSATAIDGGQSVDTSMGFTPLEGLVMGTRSGDIDPAVVRYLCSRTGMSVSEVEQWLNHASGLRGVSGRSSDVRELLQQESEGDLRAGLALEMFCYRLRKYVGAYLAVLGGADAVVFGGGIGENATEVRARTCTGMAWAGLQLDAKQNRAAIGEEQRINAEGSKIQAYVIPVDEQTLIARDACDCLSSSDTAHRRGEHD